jgi:hypothetical protein
MRRWMRLNPWKTSIAVFFFLVVIVIALLGLAHAFSVPDRPTPATCAFDPRVAHCGDKKMGTIFAERIVWLTALLPLITVPLVILRRKGCTDEINIIWYAFSLVFVIWWCLNFALDLNLIALPWSDALVSKSLLTWNGIPKDSVAPGQGPAPWTGQYVYEMAKPFLTDYGAELGLVASILIVTIAPQLLNYILAGLSGCAATPRLVWEFEKIATWCLIKFLAAVGGISVADALGSYRITSSVRQYWLRRSSESYVDDLLWGLSAVGLAFIVTVVQVYILQAAEALGKARQQKPKSCLYTVHRFFTRNLPREENKPGESI